VRRELNADPGQVVGIVRDALQSLPVAARDIKVHLNPEDAKLVRQHLPAVDQDRAWTIVEDPMLTRGGARVATASSQVDARLESRLGALVVELLGSDRGATGRSRSRDPSNSLPAARRWAEHLRVAREPSARSVASWRGVLSRMVGPPWKRPVSEAGGNAVPG
jgi:flagellar assembly protein FliH